MKIKIILIIGLVFLFAGASYAQNEAFFLGSASGVGGRALSMGSAYIAIADDYSATLWNPAGLTQLRRMELFTSLSYLQYSNDATFADDTNTDKTTKTKLNSIGFAFPIPTYRGSMVFAVGYNKIRNFDAGFLFDHFNSNLNVQQTYNEIEEGDLANWVLSGAMEVTPNMSVGASFNLWRGDDEYTWDLLEKDINNKYYYDEYSYNQIVQTKFQAYNFKLGMLYNFGLLGRFAATLSTPVKISANEKWDEHISQVEDADSPYEDYIDSEEGNWKYGLKSSWVFSAGAAFTLLPNIVISGDVEYNDWAQMRYTTDPPVGNKYSKNLNFKQNFRGTTTIRLGGEFTVPLLNTQLRAGLIRQPSPMANATEKEDRNYITLGAGILLDKQVKFDVALVHGWWKKEGTYLSDDFSDITEKIITDKIFATMSIRF